MHLSGSLQRSILVFCFFLSGAAGLIFEVVWVRHLTLLLGHTTLAISVVLAAFMSGLAIGSFAGGKVSDAMDEKKLLLCYAACELGIALLGLASRYLIVGADSLVPKLGVWSISSFHHNLFWFFVSFLPLIGPTILMGATLPLVSRWFLLKSYSEETSNAVGMTYGANTLGAVVGTAAAGFFLIPFWGLTHCYTAAAILNLTAAGLTFALSRGRFQSRVPRLQKTEEEAIPTPLFESQRKSMAVALFLSGAAAMVCQVAWTRLFSLVIGSSTYAFTIILLVFLIGLAVGSFLFRFARHFFVFNWITLGTVFSVLGIGILAYLPVFNKLPFYFAKLFPFTNGFYGIFAVGFVLCTLIMFFPTVFMGLSLPWAIATLKADKTNLGRSLGTCYAANTIGAIVGSVAAGLVLMPTFGAENSIVWGSWIYAAAGIFIFAANQQAKKAERARTTVIVTLIFVLVTGLRPRLDPNILSSGVFLYAPDYAKHKTYAEFVKDVRQHRILFNSDGLSSTVTVLEAPWGDRFLRVNGKTDASSSKDMITQLLQGYLARLLHPGQPKNALVIGLGSGVTAGALTTDEKMEAVDCVEIEPAMQKAIEFFGPLNYHVRKNPKVRFINTDARHYLAATNQKYDVITSEPSNPWIAGIANLFTKEAFELAHDKLSDDGIFCQWFHSYSMSVEDFKMVLNTFASVFPHVILFSTGDKDFFLVGSKGPWKVDYRHLEAVFKSNKSMSNDLSGVGLGHPFSLLAVTFLLDEMDFRNFTKGSRIHVDDLPVLEFSAPKYLHRGQDELILAELLNAKKQFLPSGISNLNTGHNDWALLYNLAGEAFMRSRQLDQAEDAFQLALKSASENERTWTNLGRTHNMRNEHLAAERAFRKAIALNPSYALARFHLGMLYIEQGLEENGIQYLREGLRYSPGDPMGSLQLGSLYLKKGEPEKTIAVVRDALKRPITNEELYHHLTHLLAAAEKKKAI